MVVDCKLINLLLKENTMTGAFWEFLSVAKTKPIYLCLNRL